MANSLAGTVTLSVSLQEQITPGTNLTNYNIPVNLTSTTNYADGSAANQAHKAYQASLSLAATPTSLDLTAVVCVDGTTGFSHVREIVVVHDGTTDGQTISIADVANTVNSFFLSGTTPSRTAQAGEVVRAAKPLGTAGWVIDGTHKILKLDPGANTIPCRVLILGD